MDTETPSQNCQFELIQTDPNGDTYCIDYGDDLECLIASGRYWANTVLKPFHIEDARTGKTVYEY